MKKYEKIAEWIRNEVEAGALSLLRKEGIVEGRRAGPAAVCRLYAGADGKRSEDPQPGCDLDRFQ